MSRLVNLFCTVDDFCHHFLPIWQKTLLASTEKARNRSGKMHLSEMRLS